MKKTKLSFDQFEERLKKRGYKILGSGCNADVWQHKNKKTVLRVGNLGCDTGYLMYINRIKKLKNDYFPKIYKIEIFKNGDGEEWMVTELERLSDLNDIDENIVNDLLKNKLEYQEPDLDSIANHMKEFEPSTKDRKLYEAINIIRDLVEKGNILDLHDGNMMIRKNKETHELVFTDPIC